MIVVFSDNTTGGSLTRASERHVVSHSQRGSPAGPSLDGARGDLHSSAVCSQQEKCCGRRPLSSQPGGGDGVDASPGSLRLAPQALARDGGPLCVFSQSPLWCIFCAGLGPHHCREGHHAGVLGFLSGIYVSTVFHDTPGFAQAKGLQGGGHHSDSSVLAAEGVVPGSSGTAPGTSSSSAGEVGSPVAALCLQVP